MFVQAAEWRGRSQSEPSDHFYFRTPTQGVSPDRSRRVRADERAAVDHLYVESRLSLRLQLLLEREHLRPGVECAAGAAGGFGGHAAGTDHAPRHDRYH